MNSLRSRAVLGSGLLGSGLLGSGLLGSWWVRGAVCGSVLLNACGSSEDAATAVPPFVSTMPESPAAVPGGTSNNPSNGEAMSNDGAESAPGVEPSQQPGNEGIAGGVPIDPDMSGGDPSNGGEGAASGDGANAGTEGTEGTEGNGATGAGTEGDGTGGDGEPPGEGEQPGPSTPAPLTPITIWIAGDSTVANGQTPCPRGWGGAFAPHFNDLVTITNSAVGGRSVHTWLYEVQTVFDDNTGECALNRDASGQPLLQPRWQNMLDNMKAGDYLFIQFGINDGDRTCDRHVGIEAFKTAYGMMAQAAKERGAQPVFLTPVSMVRCTGNTAVGSRGDFVPATLEVGQELDVPVIDLHERSVQFYQSLGFCPIPGGDVSAATTGPVGDFFCDDHTHFSSSGAVEIADVVVRALVEQQIPLAAYLR